MNRGGCVPIKLYLLQQVVGGSILQTPGLGQGVLDLGMENQAWNSDFTIHYPRDLDVTSVLFSKSTTKGNIIRLPGWLGAGRIHCTLPPSKTSMP